MSMFTETWDWAIEKINRKKEKIVIFNGFIVSKGYVKLQNTEKVSFFATKLIILLLINVRMTLYFHNDG